MDTDDPTLAAAHANTNQGLKKGYEFSHKSGIIEMAGLIFCDVFRSERLLLSFVDLKIILNRNINEFCLMASEADVDYRVKLTEAYLKIRKVKVSPSISIAHELALKKGPAIYPVRRVECKTFIISAGNLSLRKDNVYNGLVPKTFVFGMVDSAAFNGAYRKNPYNFKTYTTSFLGVTVNGEEVGYPSDPYSFPMRQQIPDILKLTLPCSRALENYFIMLETTSRAMILGMVMPCMLLTCADTPDMCGSSDHFNVVQRGNLAVDIKFSTAPTDAVSLVCYGEFENTIDIDSERNVVYDYSR